MCVVYTDVCMYTVHLCKGRCCHLESVILAMCAEAYSLIAVYLSSLDVNNARFMILLRL